jgi:predicted RNA binding protein YcfA (HicA-like mRNA interferase family)
LAATFDRELRDILRRHGCTFDRHAKGSHELWFSPISMRSFVVPSGIKSRHTANEVLKQAGLTKSF